jgi:hypothetical protein
LKSFSIVNINSISTGIGAHLKKKVRWFDSFGFNVLLWNLLHTVVAGGNILYWQAN